MDLYKLFLSYYYCFYNNTKYFKIETLNLFLNEYKTYIKIIFEHFEPNNIQLIGVVLNRPDWNSTLYLKIEFVFSRSLASMDSLLWNNNELIQKW